MALRRHTVPYPPRRAASVGKSPGSDPRRQVITVTAIDYRRRRMEHRADAQSRLCKTNQTAVFIQIPRCSVKNEADDPSLSIVMQASLIAM
jgi:hypothetical protein